MLSLFLKGELNFTAVTTAASALTNMTLTHSMSTDYTPVESSTEATTVSSSNGISQVPTDLTSKMTSDTTNTDTPHDLTVSTEVSSVEVVSFASSLSTNPNIYPSTDVFTNEVSIAGEQYSLKKCVYSSFFQFY